MNEALLISNVFPLGGRPRPGRRGFALARQDWHPLRTGRPYGAPS